MLGLHALQRRAELRRQQNIAVDITKHVMARDLLRLAKHIIQPFISLFIAFHVRLVPYSQVVCDLSGAGIISKQNHFRVWMQQRPALQGIALDEAAMVTEGLASCKKSQHLSAIRLNATRPASVAHAARRLSLPVSCPNSA